ncbi:hypothetical protein G7Z17_g7458 [Cylindrodendrum hubeiense]|uniref:Pentatricopeptide repeat domain-containing protein n=1 Tax=Cylindrodendrum hubeiense TaxID=595255 RepID=A0A9P5HD59_9HYPO|nr:hypothetical protein G7Z17_g7458 [Cylindrodendrum hubeiense]
MEYRDSRRADSFLETSRMEQRWRAGAGRDVRPDQGLHGTSLWKPSNVGLRYSHMDEGAWDRFLEFRGRGDFSPILDPYAESFRNSILAAALKDSTRMTVFYEVAQHLRNKLKFEWPELYVRVVHFYLGQAEYDTANLWHLRLMPNFTPKINDFRALLVSFAIDPAQELQTTLMKLYVFSPCRRVYDHLIPTLFEYGQSQTARAWRKRLVLSWASVEFAINLMHKLGLRTIGPRALQSLALREEDVQEVANRIAQLGTLGITTTPTVYCKALVSFAKGHQQDLLTDLLLCDIHPEEFDDKETRHMLLDAARRQQDQKRERLLQEVEWATIGRPEKDKIAPPEDLNLILERTLAREALGKARLILDKMESLGVNMSHANSAKILAQVFQRLWYFPKKVQQKHHGVGRDPNLDRAIHIILRVARYDIAIPLKYWRILLYNLGRLGRFDELEELSYQLVDLYASASKGLFPVHQEDLPPKPKPKAAKNIGSESKDSLDEGLGLSDKDQHNWPQLFLEDFWRNEMGLGDPNENVGEKHTSSHMHSQRRKQTSTRDVIYYIPADLPLSNQQHPVAKLFNPSLQRAIVRWGFDKKLASEPNPRALLRVTEARAADFDIAWGVRFLAMLRDQGLHIDSQVLKSAIISRIAVAQMPGRQRHRARDDRELSPSNLKGLVDEAWGVELLPPLPRFIQELENVKPKLWNRYPKLLAAAYDPDGDEAEAEDAKWLAQDAQDRPKVTW